MESETVNLIVALLIANSVGVAGIWLKLGGLGEAVRSVRARVARLEDWYDTTTRTKPGVGK